MLTLADDHHTIHLRVHDHFTVEMALPPGCTAIVPFDVCDEYVDQNDPAKVAEGLHTQPGPGLVRVAFEVIASGSSALSLGHYDTTFSAFFDDVSFTISAR